MTDLVPIGLSLEDRPCDGVVSDVLGRDGLGKSIVAIEVVVTHAIEPGTLRRYCASAVPAFELRAQWSIVDRLLAGDISRLAVNTTIAVPAPDYCEGCEEKTFKNWHSIDHAFENDEIEYRLRREATAREEREARAERYREEARWWDPWLETWRLLGNRVALEPSRVSLIDLLIVRQETLEKAREKRLIDAIYYSSTYPICRACGHRMESRDHRCRP